jgi:hypothetical protein
MIPLTVAYVAGFNPGGLYSAIENDLSSLVEQDLPKDDLQGLAGPNEVFQVFVDPENWEAAIAFIGGFVLKKSLDEIWRETVSPKFSALVRSFSAASKNQHDVMFAIKIPGWSRNAGILIESEDPAYVRWQISTFIRLSPEILAVINKKPIEKKGWAEHTASGALLVKINNNGSATVWGETVGP